MTHQLDEEIPMAHQTHEEFPTANPLDDRSVRMSHSISAQRGGSEPPTLILMS